MAAYPLPEGFSDFDMITFGLALLVEGKYNALVDTMVIRVQCCSLSCAACHHMC